MELDMIFFSLILLLMIANWILFIVFGQKTVKKLRKNSATKDILGIEFVSGYDIVNVIAALALPRRITRGLRRSPLSAFYADPDILSAYTTRFDIIFAKLLFCSWSAWGIFLLSYILIDYFRESW